MSAKVIKKVNKMIEQYVKSIGLSKADAYKEENNTWHWMRGSAQIDVYVTDGGNNRQYLCINSPIMQVPSSNVMDFYRHLLELNYSKLGIKLSIKPESPHVFAIYERDVSGMDYKELETCIRDLEWWADKLDDELQEQYPH